MFLLATLGTNSLAPAAVVDTFSARPVVPVPSCMVYDEYNSEIVVASYDRSVSFYSSSFDRRHQLQFSLDRGFYVTQPPQVRNLVGSHDERDVKPLFA